MMYKPSSNGIIIVFLQGLVSAQHTVSDSAGAAFEYAIDGGFVDVSDQPLGHGKALLTIISGDDDVQKSNYNWGSFQLENVGDKRIAAVFIDVTESMFSDIVFDNDGSGGDSVAKPLSIDFGVTETDPVSIEDYTWLYEPARSDPSFDGSAPFDPNTLSDVNNLFVDEAGDSNNGVDGGFRAELLLFGNFIPGEKVGFSGDMDPNSLAGLNKGTADDSSGWDVGGVSGAEMVNSVVTILFGDGSTATGTIAPDGSQAGAIAIVSNDLGGAPGLSVNGLENGDSGTFSAGPSVVVTATPGDTVLVSMVQAFNPVVNLQGIANGLTTAAELVEARLQAQYPEFPVNNAKSWQHANVQIPPSGFLDLSSTFAITEDLPIAFIAVVVDAMKHPKSFTSAPIRLVSESASSCGLQDFQQECTTTRQCKGMYSGSYDCWNGGGGVCLCGNGQACGCLEDTNPTTDSPVASPVSNTCGLVDFQRECRTTIQCKGMYVGADDCWNGGGGVCLCDHEVCGCLEQSECGLKDFQNECTRTSACKSKYTGAYDCWNGGGGVCLCDDNKVCGCR